MLPLPEWVVFFTWNVLHSMLSFVENIYKIGNFVTAISKLNIWFGL